VMVFLCLGPAATAEGMRAVAKKCLLGGLSGRGANSYSKASRDAVNVTVQAVNAKGVRFWDGMLVHWRLVGPDI